MDNGRKRKIALFCIKLCRKYESAFLSIKIFPHYKAKFSHY